MSRPSPFSPWPSWALAALLALVGGPAALAQGESAGEVAARLAKAPETQRAALLARVAQQGIPDPFEVAEALRVEHPDLAGALAGIVEGRRGERLRAYLAAQASPESAAASIATARERYAAALEALENGRAAEAQDAFAAVAELARAQGWLEMVAAAQEQCARSAFRTGNFRFAAQAVERWAEAEDTLGSARGAMRALFLGGLVRLRLGEAERAATELDEARARARELGDAEYEANALGALASLDLAAGRRDRGRERMQEALARLELAAPIDESWRFVPDPRLIMRIRLDLANNLALLAFAEGDPETAWRTFAQLRAKAYEQQLPALEATALRAEATLRMRAGELLEARRLLEGAVSVFASEGDRANQASTLRRLGEGLQELGDLPAARAAQEQALTVLESLGYASETTRARLALGRVLLAMGERVAAEATTARAAAEAQALGDVALLGEVLLLQAAIEQHAGRYGRALERLEQTAAQMQMAGQSAIAAAALREAGLVRLRISQPDMARLAFDQALPLAQAAGERRLAGLITLASASLELSAGKLEPATAAFSAAAQTLHQAGDARGAMAAWSGLGLALRRAGRAQDGLNVLEPLEQSQRKQGDMAGAAFTGLQISAAYQDLGRPEPARLALDRARQAADEAGRLEERLECTMALAFLLHQGGENQQARHFAREAVSHMQRYGMDLAEGEGSLLRESLAPVFEVGASAALRDQELAELLFFLEAGRAQTLLRSLGGRGALVEAQVPEELRQALASARAQEALMAQRVVEARRSGNRRLVREASGEREVATQALRAVVERVQRGSHGPSDLAPAELATLAGVQAGLDVQTAVVVYGWLFDGVVALVVTRDSARAMTLGSLAEIEPLVRALVSDEPPYVTPDHVQPLRERIAMPLALPEVISRLVICPDGPLALVPFAMLFADHDITLAPSLTVNALLAARPIVAAERVLALGDPLYGAEASSGPAHRGASRDRRLAPLPATREEAKAVGDEVLVGAEATETRWRERVAASGPWKALHLACHGLVEPDQPVLSSLALGATAQDDGYLTVLDILLLDLPARLVVLSACETGRGRVVRGEGVLGLVRAFLHAGSRSVLVSLWKVDDEATQALMKAFYAHWSPKDGRAALPAAAALRAAQAEVAGEERWAHPTYWAAWVLWGLP